MKSFYANLRSRNVQMVVDTLKAFKVPKTIETEKLIENKLLEHLSEDFTRVQQQYNIGGNLGLKVDLDVGDGEVGIEVKLSRELTKSKSSNIQRLFGQVIYYTKRNYGKRLIVLIIGKIEKKEAAVYKEIRDFLEDLRITVVQLENRKAK